MCRRLLCTLTLASVCGLALTSVAYSADPSLVGWWKLDETSGTTAADLSGNGNTGTVMGTGTWVAGHLSGGLQFNGTNTYVECGNGASLNPTTAVTLSAWIYPTTAGNGAHQHYVTKGDTCYALKHNTGNYMEFNVYDGAWYTARGPAVTAATFNNTWHHVAGTYDGSLLRMYVDGVLQPTQGAESHVGRVGASATTVSLGRDNTNNGRYFTGILDDARIYNRCLSDAEILKAMAGADEPGVADKPNPADKATDVARDAVLSWVPGQFAKTHDVYFGSAFADVNEATAAQAASKGQDAATFDPASLLAFGQTYFWRVDEVNAAPDSTVYKGKTWSFTSENYAYPVTPIKATASSSMIATMGPDKTIDGSGLDALDQHGTSATFMWLSKKNVTPIWIQYEFDAVYKLHELWVWNSNQAVESSVGFGAQDVTIETSVDGTTWTALANVPKFEQAPGEPTYTHNTTVAFGGVAAKFVKLTIASNWADGTKQAGLAEVRFFYVPVKAFGPTPANAGTDVALDSSLNWRPGREAVKHNVYISADANAVANATVAAKTVTAHTLALGSLGLEYGKTYYWRVDEVNDAAATPVVQGAVWSFTTIGYGVVEDFESYNDVCSRIFFAWIDGFGHGGSADCSVAPNAGNSTGSTVGNINPPFADQAVTHGGRQSMPLAYDNSKSPFYSETQREWPSAQSWTGGGANTLTVWLRGEAAAFVEVAGGKIIMNGTGTDIWNNADEFRFVYKQLKGNGSITAKVNSVGNTNAWAKAGVMIRESVDAASTFADAVVSSTSGVALQHRDLIAGACTGDTVTPVIAAPYWVKLTRNGTAFTAQRSVDGVAWVDITPATAFTISMTSDVLIGLAVTSHQTGSVCGGSFSNVSTTGTVTGQWQVADIGVAQVAGNTPEAFYVAVQDSAGKTKVVSNADTSVIATGVWEPWNIPLSQFTSAGVNLGSIKKMTIGVGDRSAPKAGGAGKVNVDDIQLTRVANP